MLIKESKRQNTGIYTITAQNFVSSVSAECHVEVLDVPDKPEGGLDIMCFFCKYIILKYIYTGPVVFKDILSDRATLHWKECNDNGGAKVQNYVVEKRETSRVNWTVVS